MDIEEQKRIVREQRKGYAALRRFEIEQMRSATFEDRLAAFRRVLSLSECIANPKPRAEDDVVVKKWIKIRANYDARRR